MYFSWLNWDYGCGEEDHRIKCHFITSYHSYMLLISFMIIDVDLDIVLFIYYLMLFQVKLKILTITINFIACILQYQC